MIGFAIDEPAPLVLSRPVLLYSGTCKFCRWAASVVAALDRDEQVALLPLADEGADELLAEVPQPVRPECWWLVLRDGTAVRGDRGGGVALLSELRVTAPLSRLLRAFRLSPLVDAVDKVLARYRPRLGGFVPERPVLRRYP